MVGIPYVSVCILVFQCGILQLYAADDGWVCCSFNCGVIGHKKRPFWVDKWAYIGSLSRGYPCAFNRYFLTLISGYLDQLNAVCV